MNTSYYEGKLQAAVCHSSISVRPAFCSVGHIALYVISTLMLPSDSFYMYKWTKH
jgi:hypothetical protein